MCKCVIDEEWGTEEPLSGDDSCGFMEITDMKKEVLDKWGRCRSCQKRGQRRAEDSVVEERWRQTPVPPDLKMTVGSPGCF